MVIPEDPEYVWKERKVRHSSRVTELERKVARLQEALRVLTQQLDYCETIAHGAMKEDE